jgi:hypothetical protein
VLVSPFSDPPLLLFHLLLLPKAAVEFLFESPKLVLGISEPQIEADSNDEENDRDSDQRLIGGSEHRREVVSCLFQTLADVVVGPDHQTCCDLKVTRIKALPRVVPFGATARGWRLVWVGSQLCRMKVVC